MGWVESESVMTPLTFEQLYCERRGVPPERFVASVMSEVLFPHARLLVPLLRFASVKYFQIDQELIRGAGRLRRFRDFAQEAEAFAHHPESAAFCRKTLRLRVSTRRLRRLVFDVMHPEDVAEPSEAEKMGSNRLDYHQPSSARRTRSAASVT